jgi:hypothetical protein
MVKVSCLQKFKPIDDDIVDTVQCTVQITVKCNVILHFGARKFRSIDFEPSKRVSDVRKTS